jgi:pyruvate/2-oxoglutarate dehydrogenase complex dihydrolipoamide acyltransferase (E2) component
MHVRLLCLFATGLCALLAASAQAQQIFKCTDRQGRTTYSDAPCPTGSAKAAEITSTVQSCADEACEGRRQRETELARQRLREDKQALSEMTAQRRRAEAERLEQLARLEEIKSRQAAAERAAAAANDLYGDRWGYGWGLPYPAYPIARPHRRPTPVFPPHRPALDPMYTSPPVSIRTN